jgi:hypothetical protein
MTATSTSTATTHRRDTFDRKRILKRELAQANVSLAIDPIVHGMELFGISAGNWSLIDLITHCLQATGPADVTISTWSAGNADIGFAYKLMTDGSITRMRFLTDLSFPNRQPAYCAALRQAFGDQCIRLSSNHAKFILIRNAEWNLCIRGTANLNENSRLEWFEISDSEPMADFLEALVSDIFQTQPAAGQFEKRPIEHIRDFQALAGTATAELRGDVQKFFSNKPFENDLARAGLSYLKGKQ